MSRGAFFKCSCFPQAPELFRFRPTESNVDAAPFLDRILDDEGLTAGLDETEAMALIQSLVARVRELAARTEDATLVRRQVEEWCREARHKTRDEG
jgi:hypothetical protein